MPKIPVITVTDDELAYIDKCASDRKMTRTEYVRSSALQRRDRKQILVDPIDFKFLSQTSILVGSIINDYRSKTDIILELTELKDLIDSRLDSCQPPK
jgi:hypothetical protein